MLARASLFLLIFAASLPAQRPKVLFLAHSAGSAQNAVASSERGEGSIAGKLLTEVAAPQFDVVATSDCGEITAENLRSYRAVVFYTAGELPISERGRAALLEWVREGGGFVGVHSAAETCYEWKDYGEMLGGYADGHPWNQKVRMRVEDRSHPANALLGESFEIRDQIYQFRAWSRGEVEVLYSLDPESVQIETGKRADRDYAAGWWRTFGDGRVFYTALGDRLEVWKDRRFQKHLLAGIRWAMNCERELGRAPANAHVLDRAAWQHVNGREFAWEVATTETGNGEVMTVKPGAGSIVTKRNYGDVRIHVEFKTPPRRVGEKGQARGNSGVYIQRRYEVQILDSFGEPASRSGCAAIYRQRKPDANRCAAPGVWQTYDIWFRQPRWSEAGDKIENARITVIHDGVLVHDDVEVPSKTGAGMKEGPAEKPILLQDHSDAVAFRNVWVRPL